MINCPWNNHIDTIQKKANNSLNFIHRNFKNCSSHVKEKLYKAYVRPCLEFSSSAWDPHTKRNIDKLEWVQRRAARVVNKNFSREASVTDMLRTLNWIPLQERRAKVTTVFKALNNFVDIPFKDLPRHDAYFYSFYPSSMRLWNGLPPDFQVLNSLSHFHRVFEGHTLTTLY